MSKIAEVRSAEEIQKREIEEQAEACGPVDAVRFLQSFYIWKERFHQGARSCVDLETEEVARVIERRRIVTDA